MEKITFGKNILENLTTAMYSDSRVMFREYVQNSCDAIRSAANVGIIDRKNGKIDIEINTIERTIEITDNGRGISRMDFERVLGDIANSDKQRGEDMGFRGIGRLCGLAYCSELRFISTSYGETDTCAMIWDAGKMRALLDDDKKYSAEYVIDEIRRVEIVENTETKESHFFKVIMTGIRPESDELLDLSDIKEYLSFVAPSPYTTSFLFYKQIYDFAKSISENIDEYFIFINGEQIFKNYISRTYTKEGKIKDDIKSLEFTEFKSEKGERLAWMWYGISSFDGSIPECGHNPHRGLRIRKANIQIDNGVKIRELHQEKHGNDYFIGEIMATHKDLTPNARRDYFNESPVRAEFEKTLRTYFHQTLYKLYRTASNTRSAYKSVEEYHTAVQDFKEKESIGFSGTVERQQVEVELEKKREAKEKAERKIQKFNQEAADGRDLLIERVRSTVRERIVSTQLSETPFSKASETTQYNGNRGSKPKYLANELSYYTKETRKVVSRIYDIIQQKAPEIATELIAQIQDALKSRKD
ncbi:MAG: ATP-binding protein [Spirochaetaceae bacterium]|jgi:molecular chaperone HtpG|nr:ATP-binding protein [Spirochaetaceae bacterium]